MNRNLNKYKSFIIFIDIILNTIITTVKYIRSKLLNIVII